MRDDLIVERAASESETYELLRATDILICSNKSWCDDYLDMLTSGDWVQTIGAGYDTYPVERFRERGLWLTNAPGIHGPAAGEHTLALALAFSRNLDTYFDQQRDHEWNRHTGTEWAERTMTVLGLGAIGEAVAERALAFDMDVWGIKRDPDAYEGCLSPEHVVAVTALHELLPKTDLLVVVVPLNEGTRGLVDADVFAALPETALVINIARGPIIDEDDLIAALDAEEIAGACLDVFDEEPLSENSPLWDHEDVLITPHVAGVSNRYPDRFTEVFLSAYDDWRADRPLDHRLV